MNLSDLGLTEYFEFDDGGVRVEGFFGHLEFDAFGRFFEFQFPVVGQERGDFDFVFQAGNEEFAVCWPFKNMEIERGAVSVFLLGAAAPSELREGAGLGAIN